MKDAVRALSLKRVAGFRVATWYSPTASTLMRPTVGPLAIRCVRSTNTVHELGDAWLCRLLSTRAMTRAFGASERLVGLGDIVGAIAVAWPF